MRSTSKLLVVIILFLISGTLNAQSYTIVGSGQNEAYDNTDEIQLPVSGDPFYGQAANYPGNTPDYTDNGDGTITDNNTGLMWQKTADMNGDGIIDSFDKLTYNAAVSGAASFTLGGYSDWRLPSIKELYSLFMANGTDPSGYTGSSESLLPFIDTNYFDFGFGDEANGERMIDAQYVTSSINVGTVFNGDVAMFGVNFADGRIKGYPIGQMGMGDSMDYYVKYVRGNPAYGQNDFQDNGDGTITDDATGLMWMQNDNGQGVLWQDALSYAESYSYAGFDDWRLPTVKELQSILDYTRSPSTTSSAAIDPLFNCSTITDEGGNTNYPFYWSSNTHVNWTQTPGNSAMYVSFGEALGWMEQPPMSGNYTLMDVHGAGAQRSDPKTGDPSNYPYGHGPQGDVIRIYNYVRLVRDADSTTGINEMGSLDIQTYPNPVKETMYISGLDPLDGDVNIQVRSLTGQMLMNEDLSVVEASSIDLSEMADGLYLLEVRQGQAKTNRKIIMRTKV